MDVKIVELDVDLADSATVATFVRLHERSFVVAEPWLASLMGQDGYPDLKLCRAAAPSGVVVVLWAGSVVRVQRGEGWDVANADFYDLNRPTSLPERPFQQIEVGFDPPSRTGHFGRNGQLQGHGLSVESWGGEAHLVAISSKGRSGSVRLSVPYEYLDDVLAALTRVRNERVGPTES